MWFALCDRDKKMTHVSCLHSSLLKADSTRWLVDDTIVITLQSSKDFSRRRDLKVIRQNGLLRAFTHHYHLKVSPSPNINTREDVLSLKVNTRLLHGR